jgi:hypothetical protein
MLGWLAMKRFKCELDDCNTYFATQDDLRLHESNVHGMTDNILCKSIASKKRKADDFLCYEVTNQFICEEGGNFRCTVGDCGEVFRTKYAVCTHIRLTHDMKSEFRCTVGNCTAVFALKSSLTRHHRNVHEIDGNQHSATAVLIENPID